MQIMAQMGEIKQSWNLAPASALEPKGRDRVQAMSAIIPALPWPTLASNALTLPLWEL